MPSEMTKKLEELKNTLIEIEDICAREGLAIRLHGRWTKVAEILDELEKMSGGIK